MSRKSLRATTEEELLEFQDEFLSSNTAPAAKVVRISGRKSPVDLDILNCILYFRTSTCRRILRPRADEPKTQTDFESVIT